MHQPVEELEDKLGYRFANRQLLIRALTHRSWLSERGAPMPEDQDNEQLEFLGDSILGFVVSEALLLRYPLLREGQLSQLKGHLVSAKHLVECAMELELGSFLQLGKGEERNGGRARKTLLANAFEALVAAMHLDGGLNPARDLIDKHLLTALDRPGQIESIGMLNHKSLLQERAQSLGLPAPRYATVATAGPEHAKQFTVEARVGEGFVERATASSKKLASQQAAENLFRTLSASNPSVKAAGK